MSASNTCSVTLGDVTITEDDVRFLRAPNWLNDQLLSLWVELLRRDGGGGDKCAIIAPNLAFFLMLAGASDVADALSALELPAKECVVLFINDSTGDTHGTHWSVLAYHRSADVFRMYDSGGDINAPAARKMANVLVSHLGTSRATVGFRKVTMPQQKNSYSCGDFACAVAHKILSSNGDIDFEDLPAVVDTVRPKLRAAIDELRAAVTHGKKEAKEAAPNETQSVNKI